MDESLENTGFLLQRLQELKNWQKQQEENLLKEQQIQLEQLMQNNQVDFDDQEDDTTIDQDLSSLNSEVANQSLPSWASRSSSSMGNAARNEEPEVENQIIVPKSKTFEEMLEEQLVLEKTPEFAVNKTPVSNSPKPFLRRGSGLKRYGNFQQTPKRSNSGNGLKRSQSISSSKTSLNKMKTSTSCPNVSNVQKKQPVTHKKTSLKLKKPEKKEEDEKPASKKGKDGEIYDSVELSFMGKLEKAEKKDSEDLRAFELLEEAAQDSSFCSTSSTVKKLIEKMPSPIPKISSTPKVQRVAKKVADDEDPDHLMRDIKAFLENKGAVINEDNDSEDEEETITDNGIRMQSGPQQILNEWGSSDSEEEMEGEDEGRKKSASSRKNVRFRDEAMSFSPPRIPKDGPSHLIWSIFTKEREEQRRKTNKKRSVDRNSPMSGVKKSSSEVDFEATLLNAKLTELQKEIDHYKKENAALSSGKRKLQYDRKNLAKEVQEFEANKEVEKKKMEEEKKRIRRDKIMLEKASRDRKANYDQKAHDEIGELQSKLQKLSEELQRKEGKWAPTIAKLQEQVKFLEKENQLLHEDNHKLKLKLVSPKVSTHLVDPSSRKSSNNNPQQPPNVEVIKTPDSGCHLNNNNKVEPAKNVPPNLLSFSPAESLDSEMTLVSSSISNAKNGDHEAKIAEMGKTLTIVEIKKNENKGTTEKIYSDGSVEIVYTNGNRKEISSDGKSTKVYYYNSDVKETLASGLVKYFYSQTHTWHLTYPDGKEVLQFNNGQEEIRYPNGTLQISFADGSVKRIDTDGTENINFPDGTKVIVKANGERTLLLPSGQKEIHTSTFKKREYPDGTVKILHDDGRMETRYSSGRIRIKDGDGNLLHDSNSSTNPKMTTIKV